MGARLTSRPQASALARYRADRGLSQDDLAARVGVTRNHVSMVERGHRQISADLAGPWASALGVDEPTLRALEAETPPDLDGLAGRVRAAVSDADLATLRAAREPDAPYETYERAAEVLLLVLDAAFDPEPEETHAD